MAEEEKVESPVEAEAAKKPNFFDKQKEKMAQKKAEKERIKKLEREEKIKNSKPVEVPTDLGYVSLRNVDKVYDNGVQAVFDFSLDIAKHEFIVFVGPSGCGKSTTLRMIAGLEDITSGQLYIDGEYSNDRSPKDRDIAMVFQSYALYPHMTVYNNMAFGLKIRHLPKDEIDARVHAAAKILQIEEYLDRKPKALSGGQRQRVALGRAIVRNAKVFLMDEPLSNLDAKLRVQMRSEIIKLHEQLNATTIYVTHDQTEAMTMASRIVVMKLGYIQQIGSPIEIYNQPANIFVATFIGSPAMNLLKAQYQKGNVLLANGIKIPMSKEAQAAHKEFYAREIALADEEIAKLSEPQIMIEYKDGIDLPKIGANVEKGVFTIDGVDSPFLFKPEEGAEVPACGAILGIKKVGEKGLTSSYKILVEGAELKMSVTFPDLEGEVHKDAVEKLQTKKARLLALADGGEVIYGIRPEDIHEGDEDHIKKYKSEAYDIRVTVAELLGHEYYVHTDFAGADIIAKIPMTHEFKIGDQMKILFDLPKAHIFDPVTEKRIY